MRAFDVYIGGVPAGTLVESDESVTFRFKESYRHIANRPVLSQYFEDDLLRIYKGSKGRLPAFFANLIPEEGPLRTFLEVSLGVALRDDVGMLVAVGHDLPGSVVVAESDEVESLDATDVAENGIAFSPEIEGLRFSLAGVQLKFSMLRTEARLALPARDQRGEWIVKFPSRRFSGLVQNEYAMMEWARACGFDVPECAVESTDCLPETLRRLVPDSEKVFVIRRYDRKDGARIHQEDFAQVVGSYPEKKYELSYEKCAILVNAICGIEGYREFVGRLAFAIASGNGDAHLKNWSLLYPNGVSATLAPVYDQVCTVAWPEINSEVVLKLAGSRAFGTLDEGSFSRLAAKTRAEADPKRTVALANEVFHRARTEWSSLAAADSMLPEHRAALREHWASVPLLRAQGRLEFKS